MNLNGRTVLVTGGGGFIGSALARELLQEKANVVVLDNFVTGDMENLAQIRGSIGVIEGDVRDPNLQTTLIQNNIDYVFHLAAEPYIPHCYDRPRRFFEVNAYGTLNVMLACKKACVERVLHYSTSEVYGTAKYVPMDENHPTLPASTYAVSKLAADRLCHTLHHEHEIPVIIMRQFNTYGPRETHPYIIPELIAQLVKTNKLKLGNVRASRDLTYVEDAVKAAVSLMKCDEAVGNVINVGYGKDCSVEELANILGGLTGSNGIEIEVQKNRLRPLDVERLQCDRSYVSELTGWEPTTTLKEGLKRTIEWFRENNSSWIWEKKMRVEEDMWKEKP
ncbi:MAG: NAD-dependent epimerase/dehydratase family protein [Thermoplasmata archaeon]